MFVAISKYLTAQEERDRFYPAHYAWLEKYYAAGYLLGSGPQTPRVGGLIIGQAGSREEFMAIIAEDPFEKEEQAKYEIFEFTPGSAPRRSPELDAFLSKGLPE